MNFKTTVVLLLLLLMVGGYFVFVEQGAVTTYDREEVQSRQRGQTGTPLFTADELPTESVSGVEIKPRDGAPVTLVKKGQNWQQVQPVRFPLNGWSIKQLVDDTATLRYTQRFDPAASGNDPNLPSREKASLDPPEATVTLTVNDNPSASQTIHLGKTSIGGRSYVMINDNPHIYVVNDDLHQQVIKDDFNAWRKTSLDTPTEGQIDRLTLTYTDQAITAHKVDTQWSFSPPHSGRVDTQVIDSIIGGMGCDLRSKVRRRSARRPFDLWPGLTDSDDQFGFTRHHEECR